MPRAKKEATIKITPIYEKLLINRFKPDTESHIKLNNDTCLVCENKECTKFCPSNVFTWSDHDEKIIVTYENCLECGACKSGCPYEAIQYTNPSSGYGIL